MSYIKLEVRSGGLVIKTDSNKLMMKTVFRSNSEGIELISPSSIKGMLSFLMGEKRRLFDPLKKKAINNKTIFSLEAFYERVESNKTTLHQELLEMLFNKVKFEIIKKPFLTSFYERKDSYRFVKDYPSNPSISLTDKSWDEADPTIILLKKALTFGTGKDQLSKCNRSIKESQEEFKRIFKKIKSTDDLSKNEEAHKYWEQVKILVRDLPKIKSDESKFRKKLKESAEKVKEIDLTGLDWLKEAKTLNPVYLKILGAAINEYNSITENLDKELSSKLSVLTNPDKTRHWIDKESAILVKGAPGLIACTDFNIWIENPPEEFVNCVISGPQMAYWAEGGVVTYIYKDEPIPPEGLNNEKPPFLDLRMLAKYKIRPHKEEK